MSAAPLFALDIGTRKVAGVVAEPQGQGLRVLAASVIEHPDRAMLDGQVHKVEAVAEVVGRVKAELEAAVGYPLTQAAVAAAGRALLTQSAVFTQRLPFIAEISRDQVLALELSAARSALLTLRQQDRAQELHCVGFSTVQLALDGQVLDDLAGHRGQELSAEVLATFLPRQVVDSLMTVLRRAGLRASSLTLEPIAAIEATIPPDLRRMNLALVDIGAGTSDIALTRKGTVFAYAMVTQAGDEITEKLCEHFLLEFQEGERVKRLLDQAGDQPIEFTTLLGQRRRLLAGDMLPSLLPDVDDLAQAVSERILALNGAPPKAVVMVGGGSATPGLGRALAKNLGIDAHRVGVRGPETIPDLVNSTSRLNGIEAVTLLGIALSALRGRGLAFTNVLVNQQPVQLLALQEQPAVFEALLAAGCEIKRMVARPGRAMTYLLQKKLHTLPGTQGQPGSIRVNGQPGHLDTPVGEGAVITAQEAVDGQDAELAAGRIPKPAGPAWCSVNNRHVDLELALSCNGRLVSGEEILPDRADLEWVSKQTLAELVPEIFGRPGQDLACQVRVNGQLRRLQAESLIVAANGQPVQNDYRPRPNDCIEWRAGSPAIRVKNVVGDLPQALRMQVVVNGQSRSLDYGGARVLLNGAPARGEDAVPDQADIIVESFSRQPPILSQVLDGLSLQPPQDGRILKLKVDGQPAAFTTPLRDGACVEITFG